MLFESIIHAILKFVFKTITTLLFVWIVDFQSVLYFTIFRDIILTYFVICYYLLMWTFYIKSIEHFITKLVLSQAVHTWYVERYPHGHHTCIMYCIIFSNDRMHIVLTRTKITQQNWISNAMCLSSIFLWSAKRKI